jgi:hypothetical protein
MMNIRGLAYPGLIDGDPDRLPAMLEIQLD